MGVMVQIRNVPTDVHRQLKMRAAQAGTTLSGFLLAEVVRLAARPSEAEMRARLQSRTRIKLRRPAADYIRQDRDSR